MSAQPPKENRRRRNKPVRGDWQPVAGIGWQHGPTPPPPTGLLKASRDAWATWMSAWFASHWGPENLPELYRTIRLYDRVERGEFTRSAELRMAMDGIGASLKGQQDRRWSPPKPEDKPAADAAQPGANPYEHLRAV